MPVCTHRDAVKVDELSPPKKAEAVCAACVAIGSDWVHLRECRTCGNVGCCDDSPNRHASAYAKESGHPIITSAQPSEDWSYCYVDDVTFEIDDGKIRGGTAE